VQLQVFGMPTSAASGDIEILPQGSVFGATATMVYVGSIAFNTVSTAARINPANNQISVQVRGGGAHVAIDVVGYFKRPGNYAASHTISGVAATDSGGSTNTASGDYSTVSGGRNNTASGQNSTVAGGYVNTASGEADAVAGGFVNTASGGWSTVPGGFQNVASGTFSFAAGVNAHADRKQCFVFANWETEPATPPSCLNATNIARFIMNHGLSVDYFSARSDGGGTRWVAIGDLIAGQTIATWTGGFLSDTGVWVDKPPPQSRMTDFQPVDVRQVLAKVVALPITTWRYKDAERGVRHMGPLADDFHAAFGIGYGPRAIAGMDARGVTLAAIQGLHRLVQDRDATIAAQRSEIDALSERVKRLERHRSASINE
jgi:hypothetical protein